MTLFLLSFINLLPFIILNDLALFTISISYLPSYSDNRSSSFFLNYLFSLIKNGPQLKIKNTAANPKFKKAYSSQTFLAPMANCSCLVSSYNSYKYAPNIGAINCPAACKKPYASFTLSFSSMYSFSSNSLIFNSTCNL